MSAIQVTSWVGLPYAALGIFIVGHIWRWQYDQFGWTSRSTRLQERQLLNELRPHPFEQVDVRGVGSGARADPEPLKPCADETRCAPLEN